MFWCNRCLYYTTHVSVRQLSLMTLKGLKSYHCISSWKRFLWIFVDNYRPISLLNCFSKNFERLIHKQVISFLHKHALLYQYQFGFRENHSTTTALIEIIDGIKNDIDKGDFVVGTYLDLKKAFDTVNHSILFEKLEHYGIRGLPLQLFQSYLSSRKQYVSYNNTPSYITTNKYGVPQGSVLGPLLFIIYVNDIVNAVNEIKIRLFADDTALFIQGKDMHLIFNKMKNCMVKLTDWFSCNRLTLNLTKTCYSIFHGPKKHIPRMYNIMTINGNVIHRENKVKYLGLMIDEKLSWKDHIDYLIVSLSKFYGLFNKIKYFVPKKHKLAIYNDMFFLKYAMELKFMGLWVKLWVIGFRSFLTSCWSYCSIWVLFIAQTSCIKNKMS